jgi:ABC-type spermidine/putrescine transport system permease subunit I
MVTVPVYGRVFWITLKISALTTLFCVVLGYLAAGCPASVGPRTRQVLLMCVIIPFFQVVHRTLGATPARCRAPLVRCSGQG